MEKITDLLYPESGTLQLREDIKRGIFVEGINEETVYNESQVF